jgi:hypothetical protein
MRAAKPKRAHSLARQTCGSRLSEDFHAAVGGKWFKTCDLTLAHAVERRARPEAERLVPPSEMVKHSGKGNLARLRSG